MKQPDQDILEALAFAVSATRRIDARDDFHMHVSRAEYLIHRVEMAMDPSMAWEEGFNEENRGLLEAEYPKGSVTALDAFGRAVESLARALSMPEGSSREWLLSRARVTLQAYVDHVEEIFEGVPRNMLLDQLTPEIRHVLEGNNATAEEVRKVYDLCTDLGLEIASRHGARRVNVAARKYLMCDGGLIRALQTWLESDGSEGWQEVLDEAERFEQAFTQEIEEGEQR